MRINDQRSAVIRTMLAPTPRNRPASLSSNTMAQQDAEGRAATALYRAEQARRAAVKSGMSVADSAAVVVRVVGRRAATPSGL